MAYAVFSALSRALICFYSSRSGVMHPAGCTPAGRALSLARNA